MKKLVVALMALCAVALSFNSCESGRKADEATKPVAGHTYRCTDTVKLGYLQVTFHTNYECTIEVKKDKDSDPVSRRLYVWDMSGTLVEIRYADNAALNGIPMGGVMFFTGEYNAATKRVTLKSADDPKEVYPCDFVK